MNLISPCRFLKLSQLTLAVLACWAAAVHAQEAQLQAPVDAGKSAPRDAVPALTPVTVVGTTALQQSGLMPVYAGGQVASGGSLGLLGNRDIMDTPFSITSYTAQAMQDQQAHSINDVIKNDASVRTVWADSSYGSQFTIRGFLVQGQDMALNGVYGIVPPQLTGGVEMFERVEVLRGPSALLSGMAPSGAVGGTVNLVTKRATDKPITQVTGSYSSDSQFGTHIDVGRRLGDDKQIGIRFNAAYRNGDTAIDDQSQHVDMASLGLDYRGEKVRLSADFGYQHVRADNPSRPVFTDNPNFDIPDAPDGRASLGQPWYYAKAEDTFGLVRGEVDLAPGLTAYAAVGGRHNDFLGLYNFAYLQNAAGDYRANQYYQPTYSDTWTLQGGLTGKLKTGALEHTVNLSASKLDMESGVLSPNIGSYTGSNIYDPIYVPQPSLAGYASNAPKTAHSVFESIALADTITALDGRLQVTAGIRRQNVSVDNFNAVTGLNTSAYREHAYSPAFAVLVKPWDHISLYGNYIQGLSQGPTAPLSAANAGTVFAPIKSKQYEIGAKADFDTFGASLAFFEIKQPGGLVDPGSNTFGMNGEQRNRGVEINAFGEPRHGFRVLGGVSFINGKQTKTAGGLNDGNKAVGVPDTMLNMGAEWDVPTVQGLTLSTRYIYTSSQYYNAANTQKIPAWHRIDIGARYKTHILAKEVTLRASVENLFDKNYWAGASTFFGLARGTPRTFLLSATVDF